LQVGASTNAKPFGADRAIGVDLNGDPLIACRVVEVNGSVAFCGHPDGSPKRSVCVVKQQNTTTVGRNAQNGSGFALRVDQLKATNLQGFGTGKSKDGSEGQNPKHSQSEKPQPQAFVAHKNRPLSIPTLLKPFSPSLKPFKVADQPKESDEPNGDQKPKGSPQGFRQSAQHLPHRRSPFGSFPNAHRSLDLDSG
jgi:hypothetical protein